MTLKLKTSWFRFHSDACFCRSQKLQSEQCLFFPIFFAGSSPHLFLVLASPPAKKLQLFSSGSSPPMVSPPDTKTLNARNKISECHPGGRCTPGGEAEDLILALREADRRLNQGRSHPQRVGSPSVIWDLGFVRVFSSRSGLESPLKN